MHFLYPLKQVNCNYVANAVSNAKAGQVRFRADKNGIIHGGIGKIDFETSALKENLEALISVIQIPTLTAITVRSERVSSSFDNAFGFSTFDTLNPRVYSLDVSF